jgi:hypothetical protein
MQEDSTKVPEPVWTIHFEDYFTTISVARLHRTIMNNFVAKKKKECCIFETLMYSYICVKQVENGNETHQISLRTLNVSYQLPVALRSPTK